MLSTHQLIESFRVENEYEYENCVCSQKKKTPRKASFYLFSPKKFVRLFILKEVKPSPDGKMIKVLTFDNLFPPLRRTFSSKLVVERRRLSRFPA